MARRTVSKNVRNGTILQIRDEYLHNADSYRKKAMRKKDCFTNSKVRYKNRKKVRKIKGRK